MKNNRLQSDSERNRAMFSIFKSCKVSSVVDDRAERQQKLEQKVKECIAEMGTKWLMHPDNKVVKLDKPRSF